MDGLIQFFSEYNYDGIVYGLIDNGVLGFSTLLGIDIDRYFRGVEYMEPFMERF